MVNIFFFEVVVVTFRAWWWCYLPTVPLTYERLCMHLIALHCLTGALLSIELAFQSSIQSFSLRNEQSLQRMLELPI